MLFRRAVFFWECFLFAERYLIAGETGSWQGISEEITLSKRTLCNRPGRTPGRGLVSTPDCHNADLHTMNAEELSLLLLGFIMEHYRSWRWAVLDPVHLLKIRVVLSSCCKPLLIALQCLEMLDCLSLCFHALISSLFFILLYTYFP